MVVHHEHLSLLPQIAKINRAPGRQQNGAGGLFGFELVVHACFVTEDKAMEG